MATISRLLEHASTNATMAAAAVEGAMGALQGKRVDKVAMTRALEQVQRYVLNVRQALDGFEPVQPKTPGGLL